MVCRVFYACFRVDAAAERLQLTFLELIAEQLQTKVKLQ